MTAENRTVTTAQGMVAGARHAGVTVFRGIPYAAPPALTGRFAAPQPHAPWHGVRDATAAGPTAPQAERNLGGIDMSPYFGPGWVPGEDYLTLDIWAPDHPEHQDPKEALPVMAFVHGGGFVAGSTRASLYDGTAFARSGVVLVTVNYRLGMAGFLDLPGAPRNRGLLDVIAALHWVRENIAAFGGDPGQVTLFGQSAGATLTGAVIAVPQSRGLVRRAIVQSGSGLGVFSPEQAARVTKAAAAALGIAPRADAFEAVPDVRLVEATARLGGIDLRTTTAYDPLIGLSPFSVVADRQPADAVAAGLGSTGIDLLIGTNAEEGNLYLVPSGAYATSTMADVRAAAERSHSEPDLLVDTYRAAHPGAAPGQLRSAVMGDALFGKGSWALADAHAERSSGATYSYLFDWRSGAFDGLLGATHTMELPFVFGLDPARLRGPAALFGPGSPPADLAPRMHAAWIRFARAGDPGWAPYDTHRRAAMVIGRRWAVREDLRGDVRRAWRR
ncbi:carboxylesterase/lipase family protein [Streptomyces sp. BA2]|uniref:carboxylesterase/lipase family protein n=1 Tax=Streptomyces sp. BA2 TaxID=436595 RepID=UPI00132C5A96|nr:carboxylesterase family protein [Streptomyces sp. BA2]MWA09036.1 carboxylesterase family protein [Streptomyces sp. BA2]